MLSVRIIQVEALNYETQFPDVGLHLSYGREACDTKVVKKATAVTLYEDFSFVIPSGQGHQYLVVEVNEIDNDGTKEPIAALKSLLPDDMLLAKPNLPESRILDLEGGGRIHLSLTYVGDDLKASKHQQSSDAMRKARSVSAAFFVSRPSVSNTGTSLSLMSARDKKRLTLNRATDGPVKHFIVVDDTPKVSEDVFQFDTQLSATQVEIRIDACAISRLDYQFSKNEWFYTPYPFTPGHGIVGFVECVGSGVQDIEVGQRVAMGWLCGACWTCKYCCQHTPFLCPNRLFTVFNYGGFSERTRCDYRLVAPLPREISSDRGAVLMSAGITAWSLLEDFVMPDMAIAVVGLGPVGEMACKFASKMKAKVSCFSSSLSKKTVAVEKWGAFHFVHVPRSVNEIPRGYKDVFDMILFTVPGPYNYESLARAVKPDGFLGLIGITSRPPTFPAGYNIQLPAGPRQIPISEEPPGFPSPSVTDKVVNVVFSEGGGADTMKRMFSFAVEHKVFPDVDNIPFQQLPRRMRDFEEAQTAMVARWSTNHLANPVI